MGGRLSCGVGGLLHAGACANDPAPLRGLPDWAARYHPYDDIVVLSDERVRRRPSGGGRRFAAEIPARSAAWLAAGQSVPVLSTLPRRDRRQAVALLVGLEALQVRARRSAE